MASSCVSWYDHLFSSALTPAEQACLTAAGQAQIQEVPDNVAKYYSDPALANLAQSTATAQEAQVAVDTATIVKSQGCSGIDLTGAGLGCYNSWEDLLSTLDTSVKWALGLLAVGALAYVYLVFVAPFVSRRKA